MPGFDFILAGRYRLTAPLGEGGMATVYRARDLRLNREVAVKILRDELTHDAGFLHRFEREAQTVAGLAHPNIVPVYDVGEEGGSHYIVMEYVRGRTLKEMIDAGGPLPEDRAVQVLRQVLDALAHAHATGLIHRDVKPHNILLAPDGTARLADFGIAHLADGSTTRTAAILGSAHYLSPEQSRGEEATVQSDIYACGVVLFEMLAGHPPFDGPNALAIAHLHLHETPPRLPVRGQLQSTVSRALAKDPSQRFPDASAFSDALKGMESGHEGTLAQPLAAPGRLELGPRGGSRPVEQPEDRVVLRRSARKWYILASVAVALLVAAAYAASNTVWGQELPSYPSAPYALVPGCLAALVLVAWLNARSWIYTLDTDAAVVQWGLLSHHRFGVPLRNVAALELKQSPIDRTLGVGTIEIRARDLQGKEQIVVLEDVTAPRNTYDDLVRLVARSMRQPLPDSNRAEP
jgi:tRNA A-37 threonylcarbamoyl transferase component Bud32/membrane protein YdbS with pleckstrin-like domain